MNIAFHKRLTVDEFLAWAERQGEGKYELVDGVVVMQATQRWAHSKVKLQVAIVLRDAIAKAGVPCYVASDGPTVRISRHKAFVPDALVAPLPEPEADDFEVNAPIIVVEVLSPSTARMDGTTKLRGYFKVPSVQHYLIVDPDEGTVRHHKRGKDGAILRRVVRKGSLILRPPGIELRVAQVFGATTG
jgi:Uma2 family endonuclease